MARLTKRSILLAGHATSVALEPAFWAALEDVAKDRKLSLAALVTEIDLARADQGLASACRLAVLSHLILQRRP
ncbi:ribbon-helix-helix domain-containing protein [Phenylobacterium sp.]|uniref:ribbon-helix-helix domain-containing protein n=1 Tax=Phenylobacterium sp. TaxID=1871053 RepID=UPI002730A82A|nr:ribbon-helix-helix domain-containing protein [Phenylobacterium sp.]MDP1874482.1 ribbon-helix-helix domain-containing protein [Phenylobacterium sp.]MDP3490525.1 ribbon-helix-helix domain-containing protein [Phenylobacterium sp.]